MKKILSTALSFALLAGLLLTVLEQPTVNAAFGASDFLKTSGTVIKNNSGTGSIVTLHGTNLGGWLMQEGWMSPMNTPDQFTLTQTLWNRFGTDTNQSLQSGYQDTWIQASDLDNIKNMGLNLVRVPMYWEDFMNPDGSMKADSVSFRKLDWLVTQSAQRNIYVILDFHGIEGGDCPWQSCGIMNSNQLWVNSTFQDRTVQIWERLATHYNGNPTVAGYDLMNEPLLTSGATDSPAQVKQKYDYYNRLYNAVRAKDSNHIIIVEAFFDWEQALAPSTYGWSNVVYQTHHYNMSAYDDWNTTNSMMDSWLTKMAQYQANWNIPVYAGEYAFGQNDLWEKWLTGLNALNASWSNWSYKVTGSGNWGFYTNNSNPVPDIYNDSAATIASKWSKFSTSYFQVNTALKNLVQTYATVPGTSSIKAMANNTFVSADNAGLNPLIANRTAVGTWEKYRVINNPDGTVSFLSIADNKYVTADLNQSGKLIASAKGVLGWEKFKKIDRGSGKVALQAVANNQYVSADLNQGSVLYANRASASGWEEFIIAAAP
ncbi:MAG: glycoside hydrolase family 5 protein [Bacilli bacterium]|nr:glycoside hydrolase family 5 protein [Bacilli bacterium]